MNTREIIETSFDNICRTCLTVGKPMKQIFEVEKEEALKFVTILKECTSIQISEADDLPKGLCQLCIDNVFNYYEFKRQCLLSEKKLILALQTKEIKEDDTKVNIEKVDVKDELHDENSSNNYLVVYDGNYCYIETTEDIDVKSNENNEDHEKTNFEKHKEPKQTYECDECGKKFINQGNLENHKLIHGYNCHICSSVFNNSTDFKEHLKDHRSPSVYKCSQCDKEFKKRYSLKLHSKVHTGERPHLCPFCGRAFALQTNLTTHVRIHNGVKPYSCQYCNKEFAQWSSWKSHLITHNRQRIHDCPECGKSFYRKGTLRAHMLIHSDLRNYDCNLCSKSFKTSSELKRHLNIHTGEKMYPCSYCGKSFNRQSTLTVHIRIHTDERPHVCEICHRGFIQRHVLIQHMKTHKSVINNDQPTTT